MLRPAFLLTLFLLSCGKQDITSGSRIGQSVKYDPQSVATSDPDYQGLKSICDALAFKNPALGLQNYTFTFVQQDCTNPNDPVSKQTPVTSQDVITTIDARIGSNGLNTLYFRRSDGRSFFDVETTTSGVMGTLCQSLSNLKDQIKTTDNQLITFTMSVTSSDCTPGSNQRCIGISYYSPESSSTDSYKNHTKEFMKFNTNSSLPRPGFWVERKRISTGDCGGTLQETQIATLK